MRSDLLFCRPWLKPDLYPHIIFLETVMILGENHSLPELGLPYFFYNASLSQRIKASVTG